MSTEKATEHQPSGPAVEGPRFSEGLGAWLPKLKELRACADAACDAAWGNESCKGDAVNWGDFGCVSAEMYVTEEGAQGVRVFIEEADPSCPNVHAFVRHYLAERGWAGVEVVTEW